MHAEALDSDATGPGPGSGSNLCGDTSFAAPLTCLVLLILQDVPACCL